MKLGSLFVVFFSCIQFCFSDDDLPELDTGLGRVRGFWKTSLDGRKFAAFEGIPYAQPPIGDLRFEAPQPVAPWSGLWDASTTHACLQSSLAATEDSVTGEEDCLYLNVYVPAEFLGAAKTLDVVVSIHGGAFMLSSGHMFTHAEVFMDKDIVLVSINYRLGIFGYLSTEDNVIPGNNGMKDQSLALEWVKDNIESFGGNPKSVTIIGLSAGGASVHFHYISPLSKGLFHRGISQSGTVLCPWAIVKNPLENAKKLAALVGCPIKSSQELKKCLKKRPVLNLMKQLKLFHAVGILPLVPFGPVVENNSEQPFLDKDPYWLLKNGKVYDVPWIASHTADDGLLPAAMFYSDLDKIDEQWSLLAPYILDYVHTLPESKREKVSRELLEFYLGPGEQINKENFNKFTQMCTDRTFGIPAELAAKMQSKVTKSPVYYYLFNYGDGENSIVKLYGSPEVKGVAHGEDSFYLYGVIGQKPFSEQDKRLKEAFHNMLYSYASTSKPSFDGTDTWQPTKAKELTYLNITGPEDMKIHKVEDLGHIDFWSQLGLLEYENTAVKDEL